MDGEAIDRGDVVEWRERLGRVGFVAKGVLYGIIAVIAIAVALGGEQSAADQTGALASLAGSTAGKALLVAVAIGLGAMALFRLVEVVTGPTAPVGDEREEKLERVASAVRAAVYGVLCFSAVKVLAESGSGGGSESSATSTVFDLPAGVALVLIAGVVIVGVGIYQGYRALTTSFEDELEVARMRERTYDLARVLGVAGHLARAVIFTLIGAFLVKAAVEHDADEAIGIDGALQEIAQQDYGSALLLLTAAGLLVYGFYCLIEARYRRL
jgi:hypothetical protein